MRVAGLELFGRVDRYIGMLFVGAYGTSLLLVVGLATVVHIATNLSFFETWDDGGQAPAFWILRYYVLNSPFLYLQVGPFVTTAAALFTVAKLIRYNELVACLNAGISARRLLLPVYLGAVLAALGMVALREGATARLGRQRDELQFMLDKHRRTWSIEDVYLRDASNNIVEVRRFDPYTNEAHGVTVSVVRGPTEFSIDAESAIYEPRADGTLGWHLQGGVLRQETGDVSEQRPAEWIDLFEFTPRELLIADKGGGERSIDLSFDELDVLSRRDPDNLEYQTLFHSHLTFPLANVVLLLITLPFLFGRERGKNLEGLVIACLGAIIYFGVDFTFRSLGMEGALSPLWAGWTPVLIFGSLGAALTESIRT